MTRPRFDSDTGTTEPASRLDSETPDDRGDVSGLPGYPCPARVASAVRSLERALQAAYGSDFAFSVLGRGEVLAASNLRDGRRFATRGAFTKGGRR